MKKIFLLLAFSLMLLTSCSSDDAVLRTSVECASEFGFNKANFDPEWRGNWRNVTTNKMMYVSEHNITIEFPDGTTRSYCHAVQMATQHAPDAVFYNNLMIEPSLYLALDNIAYTTKRLTIHQNGTDIINAIYARVP